MTLTLPTWLTLLRIALIPILVLVFYLPYTWTNLAAAAIFGLASLTDWLDGWIARRFEQSSTFGAFLDPVADKLMVAVALFLIVQRHPTPWMALWAALREWMAGAGQRTAVKVALIGKIKTIVQMVALLGLLYALTPPPPLAHSPPWLRQEIFILGEWLLAAAALLTLWSGLLYLRAAWPTLRGGHS